jgi:hypothetical protein
VCTPSPAAAQIIDIGWELPGAAFVSDQGGLYPPRFLHMNMRDLPLGPGLPPGLYPGQKAYVVAWQDTLNRTPLRLDPDSIVAISDFGAGDRGREQYQEFTAKGFGRIPVPDGVTCAPGTNHRRFGVTHDGAPVVLTLSRGSGVDDAGVDCHATLLDKQLKLSLESVLR